MKIIKNDLKKVAFFLALLVFTRQFLASQSTGNVNNAVQAFERAEAFYMKNAFEEAIVEYSRAIELEPKYAEAFLGRGNARCWGLDENLELAQEDYDTAAAIDTKYREFAQGFRYFREKDYTEAIKIFDKVIKNKINLMDAYSSRGNSYSNIFEYEKAIDDHTEAIRLNPGFSGNYSNRAYCYNQTEQFDEAIADSDQAIKLSPENFLSYTFRGDAYLRKKDYQKALADFGRAIRLNPDNKGKLAFYPYFLRGFTYDSQSDYSRALADYSQAIILNPDFSIAYFCLGNLYMRNIKNLPEAIKNYSKAIDIFPDALIYIRRGQCYEEMGDYDKAMADIDMALTLEPEDEEALETKGRISIKRR